MSRSSAGVVAAVDLGASSGRVMLGRVGPAEVQLRAVARFENNPVRTIDGLHWNILELYRQIIAGLRTAVGSEPGLVSIGIDSWAVDYALLRGNRMRANPYHYRDDRTAAGVTATHAVVSPEELYAASGLQFLPFNTLYQLAADRLAGDLTGVDTLLLIPDLLTCWLTGARIAERTNASTTGLLDVRTGTWNDALLTRLDLPRVLFPDLVDAGSTVGALRPDVAADLGASAALAVVTVGSHDTASAVVAVPMTSPGTAAYISCGTWSLVGVELEAPVLTEAGRAANFTNEGGVDGRIRYLRNVMGLWLLSESMRTWARAGHSEDLPTLLAAAAALPAPAALFDVDDARFLAPGDMPARITAHCVEHGLQPPRTPAETVRAILESLAAAYAQTVRTAGELAGTRIDTVHLVGGGSQNQLLCQLTADRTGLPVLAGPVEATALGNVLVQARAGQLITGSLESLRALVRTCYPPTRYEPRHGERAT